MTRAGDRLRILPGGGVGLENAVEVIRASGARELHVGSSTQVLAPPRAKREGRAGLGPGGAATDDRLAKTSAERVRAVVDALRDAAR